VHVPGSGIAPGCLVVALQDDRALFLSSFNRSCRSRALLTSLYNIAQWLSHLG